MRHGQQLHTPPHTLPLSESDFSDHGEPALECVARCSPQIPVDLDGDGAFDDGVFIDTFGDDDLALTEELRALCVVTLKDTTGARVGQALVSIHASSTVSM